MPVSAVPIVKLLPWGGKGFELFPGYKAKHTPFSGYIFGVTGGARAILALGKKIADDAQRTGNITR